ncbi:MAG: hypothetical protein QM619_02940 [Micropruina sp.]|uniref:hypothetical protein n=1 Tax=Micropruina sp. TaxID=2737536 RepID=UPI0039E34FE7
MEQYPDASVAGQHLAILAFAIGAEGERTPSEVLDWLHDLVTEPSVAAEHALDSLQVGRLDMAMCFVQANPDVLDLPDGHFLSAVFLTREGNAEEGLKVWRSADDVREVVRNALAIRLKRLLDHVPEEKQADLRTLLAAVENPPAES